jgi:hypothetical protein
MPVLDEQQQVAKAALGNHDKQKVITPIQTAICRN